MKTDRPPIILVQQRQDKCPTHEGIDSRTRVEEADIILGVHRPPITPSSILRQAAAVTTPRKIALIIVDALRGPGAKGEPPVLPSVGEDAEKIDALLAADPVDWEALDAIIARYDPR